MESNNGIGEVGVKSHSRAERDWHVGAEAHHEGSESGNSSSSSNEITLDNTQAKSVVQVVGTCWVESLNIWWADAGATRVGENARVNLEKFIRPIELGLCL